MWLYRDKINDVYLLKKVNIIREYKKVSNKLSILDYCNQATRKRG